MNILFGHIGQFEIEHVADTRHVDTACGDVGRDQNAAGALAERFERGGALRLRLVAVDGAGIDPRCAQMAGDTVGAVLGAGEHEAAIERLVGQHRADAQAEQRLLFGLVDERDVLFDAFGSGRLGRDFDAGRVLDELTAKVFDRFGHRCRKEQTLALGGQHRGNPLERVDKAEVHHLVGFVEHKDFNPAERQRAIVDQIEQPPGRCDQHVGAGNQASRLLVDRHAAKHAIDLKIEMLGIAAHVFGDLRRQFARRRQYQHAARSGLFHDRIGGQPVQRGEGECGGLAGAGLCNAEQVAPFHQGGDRLTLNRGGVGITLGFKRAQNGLGKAEFGKIGHG